jgi:hypothetical protein
VGSLKSIRPGPRAVVFCGMWLCAASAGAGDYLFLSQPYLDLTQKVMEQADALARDTLAPEPSLASKFKEVRGSLERHIQAAKRDRGLKRATPGAVLQKRDESFAQDLNAFKNALNFMGRQKQKPLAELLPAYDAWNKTETFVVQKGLEQRMDAYLVRYGPESERLNGLEWVAGEILFRGDEGGPSPWEPIARFTPVHFVNTGTGLVSTVQVGVNRYFLDGAPGVFKWIAPNHVGVAAAVYYLDHPQLGRFKGRPSPGLVLHLDRKEIGVAWQESAKTVRVTLGYAFQFVPLAF